MYALNGDDVVRELAGVPHPAVGAPLPFVIGSEEHLVVGYLIENTPPGWDGRTVRILDHRTAGEPTALVEFLRPYAWIFGPPNEEAFAAHPLASRGLGPCMAAEVLDSSWIRELERSNWVHPLHRPSRFERLRHFVLAFHDSTFECVAEDLRVDERVSPVASLWPELKKRLRW